MLASRILEEGDWAAWNEGYQGAAANLDGREERIAAEADKIERDLQLVGVTAIEDKLQEGVPDAIQTLVTAGIKACARSPPPWDLTKSGTNDHLGMKASQLQCLEEVNCSVLKKDVDASACCTNHKLSSEVDAAAT